MKIYTIIGGVNGAGKSSLTGALKRERSDLGVIIDVDKFAVACGGNARKGGEMAIKKIDECLSKGISFTQETTLAGARTVKTALRAQEAGYHIRLYYVGLNSLEDSLQRIDNRVKRGGHDIPLEDVSRRYGTRFDDLIKILPYCNEAVFFDNYNGFVEVAGYKNGELFCLGEMKPTWLMELEKRFQTGE